LSEKEERKRKMAKNFLMMAKKLQILRLIFCLRTYQKRNKKKMKNNRAQKKAQWNF